MATWDFGGLGNWGWGSISTQTATTAQPVWNTYGLGQIATGTTANNLVQYYQTAMNQQVNSAIYQAYVYGTYTLPAQPVETEEERIAREERAVKRVAASSSAEELLLMCLAENQKKAYKERKFFEVTVKGKVYRIHHGRSMNIDLLGKDGAPAVRYCAHPGEYVPDADTMLAQFLMLTTDEEKFLKIANKHRLNVGCAELELAA